jgi:hypothetical protein
VLLLVNGRSAARFFDRRGFTIRSNFRSVYAILSSVRVISTSWSVLSISPLFDYFTLQSDSACTTWFKGTNGFQVPFPIHSLLYRVPHLPPGSLSPTRLCVCPVQFRDSNRWCGLVDRGTRLKHWTYIAITCHSTFSESSPTCETLKWWRHRALWQMFTHDLEFMRDLVLAMFHVPLHVTFIE